MYKLLKISVVSFVHNFRESFLASPCALRILQNAEESVVARVVALMGYQDVRSEWRRSPGDWVYAMRDSTVDTSSLLDTILYEAEGGLWGAGSLFRVHS